MPQFITQSQENQEEIKEPMLMHLVLQQDFNVYGLHQEDYDFLKRCSVWNKPHDNPDDTSILAQKITVPYEVMEDILEIFSSCGEHSFVLRRYEHGRYDLEIQK